METLVTVFILACLKVSNLRFDLCGYLFFFYKGLFMYYFLFLQEWDYL